MAKTSSHSEGIDKEEIINYEYKMIELSLPLAEPVISNIGKYVPWELDSKIKQTIGELPYTIRWIGNSHTAYLETYAYIMLIGTGQSQANILQFKYTVYKLGRKCLKLHQQKLLVEFLCLIQYSRDKYSFLNRYPQIEAIFIKILRFLEEQYTNSDDSNIGVSSKANQKGNFIIKLNPIEHKQIIEIEDQQREEQCQKQLQQIYQAFNKYFSFINLLSSNQFSCIFRLFNNKKIYVVIEKQCFFMIQPLDPNPQPTHNVTLVKKLSDNNILANSQSKISQLDAQEVIFDNKQFYNILNNKNEVEQSHVISIQRGSQIRKTGQAIFLENYGYVNTPQFNQVINPFEPNTQQKEDVDKTFIDQLLNNVVIDDKKDKQKEQKRLRKEIIANKMKNIRIIKEELQIVRMKIEGKLKLIDEAQKSKKNFTQNRLSPISQKLNKSRTSEKKYVMNNIVMQSVMKNHQNSNFLKKQRKTSYNSVNIIPNTNLQKREQTSSNDQSNLIKGKSTSSKIRRMQRLLSQQIASRPQSQIEDGKALLKCGQMMNKNQRKIQSHSPNNVNVNVNVNISEIKSSFPMQYQQFYHHPNIHHIHTNKNHYFPSNHQGPHCLKNVNPIFIKKIEKMNNNPERVVSMMKKPQIVPFYN